MPYRGPVVVNGLLRLPKRELKEKSPLNEGETFLFFLNKILITPHLPDKTRTSSMFYKKIIASEKKNS